MAFAGKRELVALAAGTAVTCRHSGESEAHVGAAVNGERNLACAGHHVTACADALCTPVLAFGLTLVCALPGVVRGVRLNRTVGLAAVPVTGCPAGSGFAAVLDDDVRASAGQLLLRAAGLNLLAAGRLRAGAGLRAARGLGAGTGLGAGAGLRAARRLGSGTCTHFLAFLACRVVVAIQLAFLVVGVLFVLGALEVFVMADAFARRSVVALIVAAIGGRCSGRLRLLLLLAGAGRLRLLLRTGGLRLFRGNGRRSRGGGYRAGRCRFLAALVGVFAALVRILALVRFLTLVRVNGVRIVKDIAVHVGNFTVGSDKGLFRGESCKSGKVDSRGNRRSIGVDDCSRCNIEVANGGTTLVRDDESGVCRGDDIRLVTLENPASGGDRGKLVALLGGVGKFVVGAVPSDHQSAGKQQCFKKWKFHHNLMFLPKFSRP